MGRLVVRQATVKDVPAICGLRDAYFAAHGQPVQQRPDAQWWVAEHEGRIVAVQAYDQAAANECWVVDSYTDGSKAGAVGLDALSARIAAAADEAGCYLLGIARLEDRRMIRHGYHRGWQVCGVLLARPPHTKAEVV